MMRRVMIVLAMVLWTGQAIADAREDLLKGIELARAENLSESKVFLDRALESGELPPDVQGLGHYVRALVHWDLKLVDAARADLDRAVALMEEPGSAYVMRSKLAWAQDDKEQTYKDMLKVAASHPKEVNEFEISDVWRIWRWLRDEKRPDDQFALLEALAKAKFRGDDKHVLPDALMSEYAATLIGRDRLDEADRVIEPMMITSVLIGMRFDGRYRKLWNRSAFKRKTDPKPAAERELKYWVKAGQAEPRSLKVIHNQMQILRALNRPADAVALGKKVLAAPANFENDAEYMLWVYNELFYALIDVGQTGEANAMMEPLLQRSVEKEPSLVNQLINYGAQLAYQSQPEKALKTVEGVKREFVSPFGQKWVEAVQVCAHVQMNNQAEADAVLERMKQAAEENYSAVMEALLCLNRMDDAAQLMITRLRDPVHYEGALSALQTYAQPQHQLPFAKVLMGRMAELRTRADIRTEVAKRGRLLTIPLTGVYWGEF